VEADREDGENSQRVISARRRRIYLCTNIKKKKKLVKLIYFIRSEPNYISSEV